MRNEAESAVWRLLYPESQEAFQKVRHTHYMLRRTGRLGKAVVSSGGGDREGKQIRRSGWDSASTESTVSKGVH